MEPQLQGFQQVQNIVQYRKIQQLDFLNIDFSRKTSSQSIPPSEFQITLKVKYAGLIPTEYKIVRKLSEITELLQKMHQQHKQQSLIPNICQESGVIEAGWKGIRSLVGEGDGQKKAIEVQMQTKFTLWAVGRMFTFLAKLTLPFLYRYEGKTQSALFVFISERFKLYNSSLYEKKNQGTLEAVSGLIFGSSNKLKDYFSKKVWQGQNVQYQNKLLLKIRTQLEELTTRVNKICQSMQLFESNIQQLGRNFLTLKQPFKARSNVLFKHLLTVQYLKKSADLLLQQVLQIQSSISAFYNQAQFDQKLVQRQVDKYKEWSDKEIAELKEDVEKALKSFTIGLVTLNYCHKEVHDRKSENYRVKVEVGMLYEGFREVNFNQLSKN